MRRVLLTGASGLLGSAVQDRLNADGYAVSPCYHSVSRPGGEALDVADARSVADVFERTRPELVVHCAGWADVVRCEDIPDRARLVNAWGTELVAEQAARHAARLVHVSTDWVFPGTARGGYREYDPVQPLQVYGQTKLAAEEAVTAIAGSLVVRVPLLYSLEPWPRPTWPTQALAWLSRGEPVLADDVEIRQPALISDVADCLLALIKLGATGVVHVAPAQTCTKFGWSRLLARSVEIPDELVRLAPQPDRPDRPLRSTLCTPRLVEWGISPPRGVSDVASAGRAALLRQLSSQTRRAPLRER